VPDGATSTANSPRFIAASRFRIPSFRGRAAFDWHFSQRAGDR